VKVTASATVTRGKKTNRVNANRKRYSPTTAATRYKRDPAVHGLESVMVCISIPTGELVELDAVCERVPMSRSHFIRQAVKHFGAYVLGQGEQAKRWKEALR
jgi:hypothetical protein